MKEETKKVLLYKPSEMLAVDIKPLKFLDAELLCLISQPAARAKCKCWGFQLADAAQLHQVTIPVTLPLGRAVLVSPCWWTSFQFASSLLKERSAEGAWIWRVSEIFSTSDVRKAENKTNFCCADCLQEWSAGSAVFPTRCNSSYQSVTNQWLMYLPEAWYLPVLQKTCKSMRYIKLKIHKLIRQGTSSPTPHGKFRTAVKMFSETCENSGLWWIELVAEYFQLLPLNSLKTTEML